MLSIIFTVPDCRCDCHVRMHSHIKSHTPPTGAACFAGTAVVLMAAALHAQTLVHPPYLHSYGIRKATPVHLFMFFGPRTSFRDPQGLATAKMRSRDDPATEHDDDEVVVYGVNSGRHQLIYNTSMWTLSLYGSKGSGRDQFNTPRGVACDPDGNVYVVDGGNNRIVQLFNPRRAVQWVRAFGRDAGLNAPSQVALDEWGRVYVSDTGNRRLVVFDSAGTLVDVIGSGEGGIAFTDGPTTLAVADGLNPWSYFRKERVIFCADNRGGRIWKLRLDGGVVKKIRLPDGHRASYAAVDYYHNLWLTDTRKHCVLKYDHSLALLDIFGSRGSGDNQFEEPRGIAIWKRYGQTFIAEKAGAQYYWIGTRLKEFRLRPGAHENRYVLHTDLTEYSYVTLFAAAAGDTSFFLRKRFIFPGPRRTSITAAEAAGLQGAVLRVEPTYSSYTYYHTDHQIAP
ncbi:MAG: hypothetical protein GF418_16205 [Chitinivibrionales bacterium]|nr:hypothetical protein [Chitinivibrionales bacterium]MBD3397164.1 hypothetical protein [Chitinivibrionales bacterium]